jgi:glycosyltransferase involved in cell wall biosynthesis
MSDVVHVITGLGTGGAEAMLVRLAVGLQARGLSQQVVSLSAHDALAVDLRAANIDFTCLNGGSWVSLPAMIILLARNLHRAQPKIIQGWMYHGNIAATLCHYASHGRRNRRLFWNLRASNMDQARYGQVIAWSRLLSRLPDTIVVNSEVGAAFHCGRGFHAERLTVIDNGIDTKKFRPDSAMRGEVRAELGIGKDAVLVINVARVDPMKDHDNFLAAMKLSPSAVGLLVGSGTEGLSLPANVHAVGLRGDVARLLAAADLVVSTSAFGEGFSNAIAEGMSAGLIPIATDIGDARRIIGDTGFIVPPRNPGAFAEAINAAAALPKVERLRRGELARQRIISHFTLDAAIDRYLKLYVAPQPDA